ncbi:lipopolysaccharide heptosyltransferase II [Campylobacter showae]|uniref:lipopolysaccharide heptosyltransferase II n=1 Tax=Campylobacter showae TaxID=204 RepID=UPI003B8A8CD0
MRILIELPTWLGDAVMASAAVEAIAKHAAAFGAGNLTGKFENERDFSFLSQNFGTVTQEIQIFKNDTPNLNDKFDADGGVNLTANAQENQNLENLADGPVKIVFFGSFAACELFKTHPSCERVIVDSSKKAKFRLWRLFWQARSLGKFDAAFSFRSSFASKILLFGARAGQKFIFQKNNDSAHQVQKYLKFVKAALNLKRADDGLKLYFEPRKFDAPVLGLNPGANYGSAKRWYPAYFAQVALHFKDKFKIMIFGGAGERDICEQIEQILRENGAACENLAGKTSVRELCENIGGIGQSGGIFVTNDSGPMHIAAAYKTPTIALFGPTRFTQTCPWRNENARILRLNLECMPCMKRVCPLKTHACMKDLSPQAVIQTIEREFLAEAVKN